VLARVEAGERERRDPGRIAFPVDLIELAPDEPPGDLIVGRVALILNEP